MTSLYLTGLHWLPTRDITAQPGAAQPAHQPHQTTTHPKSWNIVRFELALGSNGPTGPDKTQNSRDSDRQRPGLGLDLAANTRTASTSFWAWALALPSFALATWRWLPELTSLGRAGLRWLAQLTSLDLTGLHWLPACDIR